MKNEPDLLPCPSCMNGTVGLREISRKGNRSQGTFHAIRCCCGMMSVFKETTAEAVEYWNNHVRSLEK